MGGSARGRRPKAAAGALRYEHRPRVRGTGRVKARRGKRDFVVGSLFVASVVGLIVLLAVLDRAWGDATWRWAADRWPGGAYGFAVCLGVAAPCLFAVSLWALSGTTRRSWRTGPARALARAVLAVATAAPLLPFVTLAWNATDDGEGRAGSRNGPPSWAFRHCPWLWLVGLATTVVTVAALVALAVMVVRRRPDPAPPDTAKP
ncbi:hypothetical protein [Streptomyces sp. NPDC102462]|uniref:hypothetical protein n=1 Tax=Streptomyces sp. NPDC102462 TaxID=3366178 RepID=UPI003808B17A